MSIIDTLITDRTAADTAALEALYAKARAGTITDEEWAVLNDPTHKGAYNYTDLNRVNAAMDYLDRRLRGYGYVTGYQSINILWTQESIPNSAVMGQYLENVGRMRNAIAMLPTTPALPGDMEGLSVEEANAIEFILLDVNTLLNNMVAAWYYSGDLYSGEV